MPVTPFTTSFHGQYISPDNAQSLGVSFKNGGKSFRIDSLNGVQTANYVQADAFPTGNYSGLVIAVSIPTVTGTSPTLTIDFQTSTSYGGSYSVVQSSGTITTSGVYYLFVQPVAKQVSLPNHIGNFGKIHFTIGGTTPSFTIDGVSVTPFYITTEI